MKRTLSLLRSLVLLCGILVPAVQAAESNPNLVEISCPKWRISPDANSKHNFAFFIEKEY